MAFPQVVSITPGTFSTEATQHLVPMPATVNAGDLLVALISTDGSAAVTTPGSFTLVDSNANASACRLGIYYRIADGTEGGTTVDFVTAANETMASDVYRITGWHGTTPPEVGSVVTATTANPDSVGVASSWGAEDNLFIVVFGTGTANTASAYPTNYTDGTTHATGGSAASIGSARRELNAASDNPGSFTITGTVACLAQTVVIRPSSGGTQALTGTLFTKAPTFFTGAITATYSLTGTLFAKAPTFPTGVVTPGVVTLTGTLFTKAPTFPTGVVSLASSPQTLTGTLFTKAPTFPQGAVTTGAVILTGVLFAKAPTFFTGTVTAETVTLTGTLFQKAPTFPTGTIGQAGTLFGTLFVKAPTFFTGSFVQGGPSFWTPNPAAYVGVTRYGPSPWGAELSGQRFEKAPTFPVGTVS